MVFFEWVKKYWALLLGALVALIGFLLGVSIKKTPVIVVGDDPEKKKSEQQTQAQIDAAQKQRDQEVTVAKKEEQQAQAAVVTSEEKKTEEIKSDVNKTNDFLKDVSNQIEGKP